uniref:transposase n=1 Tax=Hamadaea tsunoensis TaxID=53368 RepID=UPI001B7FE76A
MGVDTAGQLLVTTGDNPDRLRSEAAFARLCGAAPIPVSSGRTDRHRLHRGGDRLANNALWRIALVRMRCHQPTKDCVARRTTEGKTKPEIMRCLKRYVARETYPLPTSIA